LVTPPSKGMPISPISTFSRLPAIGARMKLGIPV
jgi:hypothetical protein